MNPPTNADRASFADTALKAYAEKLGYIGEFHAWEHNPKVHDYPAVLSDLLADLHHWADLHEYDFTAASDMAHDHHAREHETEKEHTP